MDRLVWLSRFLMTPVIFFTQHVVFISHHMTSLEHVTAFTLGACDGNPCMNGGQCVDMGTEANPKQFTCACAEGYTGLTCQKRVDPCADEPCQNGGICEPRGEHFHCSCSERFKGKLCEQYIRKRNPCLGDPCGAHGFCEVVNYDFICQCSPGFHGSRCEFEEEEEEEVVPVDEDVVVESTVKEESDARSALVIGEVVLAFFVIFVVILLLFCVHWMRVANKRSKLQAAEEFKKIAGKPAEPVPGWFETSNQLCYDFFCYCCKLVNKYENESRGSKILIGEGGLPYSDDPNTMACINACMQNRQSAQNSSQDLGGERSSGNRDRVPILGNNQTSPKGSTSKRGPGSSSASLGSQSLSKGSKSKGNFKTAPSSQVVGYSSKGSLNDGDNDGDEDCSPQNQQQNALIHSPYMDYSQNRVSGACHGQSSYDSGSRTARGALPGFQQGSQFQYAGSSQREMDGRQRSNKRLRVRRVVPSRGRSGGAVVDIYGGNDGDEDGGDDHGRDEDEYDSDDIAECGAMVGPAGSRLPMAFHREGPKPKGGNVDHLYFDDNDSSNCLNQSNSFSKDRASHRRNNERPGSAHYRNPTDGRRLWSSGGNRRPGRNYSTQPSNADDSDSDDCGSHCPDSDIDADEIEDDDDDDDSNGDDDDDAIENGGGPYVVSVATPGTPISKYPPRRTRREHHCNISMVDDDGYSSTGRLSESDAGGRSRDPLSLEAVTRNAHRKFYSRQGQVSGQELPVYRPRGVQDGSEITMSSNPSHKASAPVAYNNFSPSGFPQSPAPFTAFPPEPHENHVYRQKTLGQQHPYSYRRGPITNSSIHEHPSYRRPRSSFKGWDRNRISANPGQHAQLPLQPMRKQKVKGILKKTSAYGGDMLNTTFDRGRSTGNGQQRSSSHSMYGYASNYPASYPNHHPDWSYPSPAYDGMI